jgi:hypothetical protein
MRAKAVHLSQVDGERRPESHIGHLNRKYAKSAKLLFEVFLSYLCVLRVFAFQIHTAAVGIDLICGDTLGMAVYSSCRACAGSTRAAIQAG